MNRRTVLKGMLAFAAGGALVACRRRGQAPEPERVPEDTPTPGPPRPGLQTPAAPAATPAATTPAPDASR